MSEHLFSLTLSKPVIFDNKKIEKIWFDKFTGKHMRKIRMSAGVDGDDQQGSIEIGSLMTAGELALAENMGKIEAAYVVDNLEPADTMALVHWVGERISGGQETGKTPSLSSPAPSVDSAQSS